VVAWQKDKSEELPNDATAIRSLSELEMNKGRLGQVGNRHDGDHPFNKTKGQT